MVLTDQGRVASVKDNLSDTYPFNLLFVGIVDWRGVLFASLWIEHMWLNEDTSLSSFSSSDLSVLWDVVYTHSTSKCHYDHNASR